MKALDRITFNSEVMGGKPCIRGMRVTVGTVVGLMASGHNPEEILKAYPYLEIDDIYQALETFRRNVSDISSRSTPSCASFCLVPKTGH